MTSKEEVMRLTAEIGRASGLEAGAKVMRALADHKRRVVGTSEIKAAAMALEDAAADLRAKAKSKLRLLETTP